MAERYFKTLQVGAPEPVEPEPVAAAPIVAAQPEQPETIAPAPGKTLPTFQATKRPASAMHTAPIETGKQQGFWSGLIYGNDENQGDTIRSTIGSTLTDFVRHGVDAGFELFSEDRKNIRKEIDRIRAYDPQMADEIESSIGAKKSTTQNVIRLAASVGEGILTVIPVGAAAKVIKGGAGAVKGVQAANVAGDVAKMGYVARTLKKVPGMSDELALHAATGFKYGAGYGALAELQKNADFVDAVEGAALGGTLGIAFPFAAKVVGAGSKLAGKGASGAGNVMKQVGFNFGKFLEAHPKTMVAYKVISPISGTLKQYYGDVGQTFVNLYEKVNRVAQIEIANLAEGMVGHGLMRPPGTARSLYKNVEYIAENKELMTEANLALRGLGMYKDPNVRKAFMAKNPQIAFIENRFKEYGASAQKEELLGGLLENYVPKYTQAIPLKGSIRGKISQVESQAEREALYAANNPEVAWMVENAVLNEKAFKTLDEGFAAYYDWADYVESGGRMGFGDNKFLNWMVTSGKATSLEEAEQKLAGTLKFRDAKTGSLSRKASSLDFERMIDMPFYDPNPARVLGAYGNESITRINNSKVFGAKDEIIDGLILKVQKLKGLDQAQAFSQLVQRALKGSTSGTVAEDISGWIRGVQVFKLGFSQVLQLGQNLNTLVSTDFKSLAYGLSKAFQDEGVQRALKDGALMNSFVREMHMQSAGVGSRANKMADKFLNAVGLTRLDAFNRVAAANAGEEYARRQFNNLMKRAAGEKVGLTGTWKRSVSQPEALRLRELGINVEAAIKRGELNDEDLLLAGYSIAKESQFLGRPIDLPYFASSASGKAIMQFRNFAYQQGTFLKRQIWDDISGKGDFKRGVQNLAIFATLFPLGGEVIADIRSAMTGSKRPPPGFDRYVDNILSAGGFGLAYDALKSARQGHLSEWVLGAGAGEIVKGMQNVASMSPEGLAKQGVGMLPGGSAVKNRIWPSKREGTPFLEEIRELLDTE